MHASGAVATKLAPFIVLAFAPAASAPGWSVAILVALGVFQIATDVAVQHEGQRLEEGPPGARAWPGRAGGPYDAGILRPTTRGARTRPG